MLYITGDTHGRFQRITNFCQTVQTSREDIMIILGDAGINYHGNMLDDNVKIELDKLPITLFCIHGNHEQRPYAISTYEEMIWHGGSVYYEKEYPSILFAKDGEIYHFDGKKVIAIGGAYSIDKYIRLSRNMAWYDNEQPSPEIKKYVEDRLKQIDWKVDIVLSHTVPLKYEPVEVFLQGIKQSMVDKTTEIWLDKIEDKLSYQKWYAGHYHTEKSIDSLQIMFENIEKLIPNN